MAQWMTPTDEQRRGWMEWYETRPPIIKQLCDKLSPWSLYMLKDTRHRCTIYSYNEDGTVTVSITGQYNLINFGRRVFGIKPEDLTECDLPADNELVGVTFSPEEELIYINQQRADHGLGPLSMADMQAIKQSDVPQCAIDTPTSEVSDGDQAKVKVKVYSVSSVEEAFDILRKEGIIEGENKDEDQTKG